MIMENCIFK